MASLDPFPTRPATPDADGEPGDHRSRQGRQVGLELLRVTLMHDIATAVRAAARQWGVQFPVDTGQVHTMTMTAMSSSSFASRPFRLIRRLALRVRSRLMLSRTPRFLQQLLQLGDTPIPIRQRRPQLADLRGLRLDRPTQLPDFSGQRGYGGRRRRVASRNSPSYAPRLIRWWTPLYKYPTTSTSGSEIHAPSGRRAR